MDRLTENRISGAADAMEPTFLWKNFKLGEELSVSGALVYNGLRRFYELKQLDFADEIFEVFYYHGRRGPTYVRCRLQ